MRPALFNALACLAIMLVVPAQAENMAFEMMTKGTQKAIQESSQVPGNWTGSGGNGYALAFSQLGYRLHREMLMEPYKEDQLQVRDQIPTEGFLQAVDRTKVVVSSEPVYDRNGDPATAVYLLPSEVKQDLIRKGFSPDKAEQMVEQDYGFGLIKVDEKKFKSELKTMGIALGTVYHEYLRVMGVGEKNYNLSGRTYDAAFMSALIHNLETSATPLFQKIGATVSAQDFLPTHIFDALETEKTRVRAELVEDEIDLKASLAERRPLVDEARKQFSQMGNAYADMVGSMGLVPMPFPSYQARVLRGVTKSVEKGMGLKEKMEWIEVINKRIEFLNANLERNYDFFLALNKKRQDIYLRAIDQETERWFKVRNN